MKPWPGILFAACALAIYPLTTLARTIGNGPRAAARSGERRTPVLVELFTSEGCSSCPPADAELAHLVRDQPIAGAEVIALSLHVDYWNNLGWKDPYSSSQFSRRQGDYGQAFHLDSVYTPQMVVDGRAEFVGSDGERAVAAIRSSAAVPTIPLKIDFVASSAKVEVPPIPGKRAEVMLAITEDDLSSNVRAGENSGRRLAHVAVVRSLRQIGEASGSKGFAKSVEIVPDATWKREGLSAVVFVQEVGSRRILGVGQARIAAR